MNKPIVGKTYKITHSRKGRFTGKIVACGEEFCDILITEGRAGAICEYNEREEGEVVSSRIEFCKFEEIE